MFQSYIRSAQANIKNPAVCLQNVPPYLTDQNKAQGGLMISPSAKSGGSVLKPAVSPTHTNTFSHTQSEGANGFTANNFCSEASEFILSALVLIVMK